ncbi:hypothetical protein BDR03DRAFT_401075 [Suillus americanus]|nr:hypothetical protein BDR03DRAFT_401075 [Suillus americanus]
MDVQATLHMKDARFIISSNTRTRNDLQKISTASSQYTYHNKINNRTEILKGHIPIPLAARPPTSMLSGIYLHCYWLLLRIGVR